MRRKPLMRNLYVKPETVVRGTAPTILRVDNIDFALAVYDSNKKAGYILNTLSEASLSKEYRAKTFERLLQRVREDKANPQELYAVLIGDALCNLEWEEEFDDGSGYSSVEEAIADHNAYRNEQIGALMRFGIPSENISPCFTRNIDYLQSMFLNTKEGEVEIKEYAPQAGLSEWISLRDNFKDIKVRRYNSEGRLVEVTDKITK